MPLYEYSCPKCNSRLSRLVKLGETSLPKCSKCGLEMNRVISRFSAKTDSKSHGRSNICQGCSLEQDTVDIPFEISAEVEPIMVAPDIDILPIGGKIHLCCQEPGARNDQQSDFLKN